ncbi:MAG: rhomboid family intramembrane serine protease [Gemmatimonadetes bacterium]|nr:rhomboid family intramembrane serine protease [Gemmatimonadota bacterium]
MIPISDENDNLRAPVANWGLMGVIVLAWLLVQGAGFDSRRLAASVCNYGMVPGEITGLARLGLAVPLGQGMACVVDDEGINWLTPLLSMFLHGGWAHLLANLLFLHVFGDNVEDSMGRRRYVAFYLACGLAAAAAHAALNPGSPIPTVGASGAISGVMGAYLVMFPMVRVRMLFLVFFVPVRAWLVLLYWFGLQLLAGLTEIGPMRNEVSTGVAVWAHVGGFVAGVILVRWFENPELVARRARAALPVAH